MKLLVIILSCFALAGEVSLNAADSSQLPVGWTTASPRDEIKPQFAFKAKGGVDGQGKLGQPLDDRAPPPVGLPPGGLLFGQAPAGRIRL